MEHVAILNGNWLDKILSGEKTCETRWYKPCIPPMAGNKRYAAGIVPGEVIYFKQSGKPITAKAIVKRTEFYQALERTEIERILTTYPDEMGFGIEALDDLLEKKYCALVFLKNVEELDEPFNIDKSKAGYGNASAWITVPDVNKIKVS